MVKYCFTPGFGTQYLDVNRPDGEVYPLPAAAVEALLPALDDLKGFISQLPTAPAGDGVDDVEQGTPVHYLEAGEYNEDPLWACFVPVEGGFIHFVTSNGDIEDLYSHFSTAEQFVEEIKGAQEFLLSNQ